jgi:ACS family hexuronate transporter-like MFS transporter
LLFLISVNNYMDRQMISIVSPVISEEFKLSASGIAIIVNAFLLSYTFGQLFAGRFMDWVGSRNVFAAIVLVWSFTGMLTSLARGVWSFSLSRFLLGAAESGNFPGGVKVCAEWFPARERSTAVGLFVSGAAIGAVLTPPVAAYLIVNYGWQTAFIVVGLPGLLWILVWRKFYAPVETHPRLGAAERSYILSGRGTTADLSQGTGVPWTFFLRQRVIWGVFLGRFLEEPVAWFYYTWLPFYLRQYRDVSLMDIGVLLTIPFLTLDVGYVAGGWVASRLLGMGFSLNWARKAVMLVSALCMSSSIVAATAATPLECVLLVSIATFGHGSYQANILTIPGDVVPHRYVGTLYGMTGFAGGIGSIIFMQVIGTVVDVQQSFNTVFFVAGIIPLLAFAAFAVLARSIEPLGLPAPRVQASS